MVQNKFIYNVLIDAIIQEEQMTDDGRMLSMIREYRAGINEPDARWPEIEFNRAAYSRWAVDEILMLIVDHPEMSVLQVVNSFKNMMHEYSKYTSCYNEDAKFIFDLAWEVASDIEDQITGML
jgi:hypothetical protein